MIITFHHHIARLLAASTDSGASAAHGPDKPPTIHSIQALRAVAVLLVLSMHVASAAWLLSRNALWAEFSKIGQSYGHAGVDLFFVISGTIMYILTRAPRHQRR